MEVSDVHPVSILRAVFCGIYSLFVADASGGHVVETYPSMSFKSRWDLTKQCVSLLFQLPITNTSLLHTLI